MDCTFVTRTFFVAGGALTAFLSPQATTVSEKTKRERRIPEIGRKKDGRKVGFCRAFCIRELAFCLAAQADLLAFGGRSIVQIARARSNALRLPGQTRATAR